MKVLYDNWKIVLALSTLIKALYIYRYLKWDVFPAQFLAFVLTITLTIIFLEYKSKNLITNYLFVSLSLISGFYLVSFYKSITDQAGNPSYITIIFGVMLILLTVEAVRRVFGQGLLLIIGFFLLYPFIGPYLPGIFRTRLYSFNYVVEVLYYQPNGLLGMPLDIAVSLVSIFIFMGACLKLSGATNYLSDFLFVLLGKSRGGPAKVAIISSAAFGTISGSPAANVSTTGVLTIPLMKKIGYSSNYAAAVEATASTGGAFTPPIMGAAVFLMAEFLSIPYSKLIVYAAIPAFLYFLGIFIQVHFESIRLNLEGLPQVKKLSLTECWRVFFLIGFPITIFLFFLLYFKFQPSTSSAFAILSLFLASYLYRDARLTPEKILIALKETSQSLLQVVLISAAAGIVVAVMLFTNLGGAISYYIFSISEGFLLPALIFTALSALVLGMGMPTTPVYIILVFTAIPVLLDFGVNPVVAHLFAFYFGVYSFITPPVCVAIYVARAIADSDVWKSAVIALRLAIVGFIFPFLMVYYPVLILVEGEPLQKIYGILLSILFAFSISFAISSYKIFNWKLRGITYLSTVISILAMNLLF